MTIYYLRIWYNPTRYVFTTLRENNVVYPTSTIQVLTFHIYSHITLVCQGRLIRPPSKILSTVSNTIIHPVCTVSPLLLFSMFLLWDHICHLFDRNMIVSYVVVTGVFLQRKITFIWRYEMFTRISTSIWNNRCASNKWS